MIFERKNRVSHLTCFAWCVLPVCCTALVFAAGRGATSNIVRVDYRSGPVVPPPPLPLGWTSGPPQIAWPGTAVEPHRKVGAQPLIASRVPVVNIYSTNTGPAFSWTGGLGKVYIIERSTDGVTWVKIITRVDHVPGSSFYRLRVE